MLTVSDAADAAARGNRTAAVIFDLDGTLVDSVGDITASINEVLATKCLAPFSIETILTFIGDGADALVERAFYARGVVFNSDELVRMIASYELAYGARLASSTKVYEGVVDIIAELRTKGVGIGICTNKTEDKAISVVEALDISKYVDVIVGARRGQPPKPSPIPLLRALQHFGLGAIDTVMVGDSNVDVECARAAGVTIIGVSFGYSRVPMRKLAPHATIASYAEFMAAYASLKARPS
jgi:phosphoglycolate phosphatase